MVFHEWNRKQDENPDKISTDLILHQIKTDPVQFQKQHLNSLDDISFHEYLKRLMKKYRVTPKLLIIRSCLSKPFVYQIIKGERVPGREVILRISLAMGADMDETQHLLMRAEKGILYPRARRDAAILCCIASGKSLEDTDLFLRAHGERPLL